MNGVDKSPNKPDFSSDVYSRTFTFPSALLTNNRIRARSNRAQPEVQKVTLFLQSRPELDSIDGFLLICINHILLITEENFMFISLKCTRDQQYSKTLYSPFQCKELDLHSFPMPTCCMILIWSFKWETI